MMSLLPTVPDVPSSTYDRADAAARCKVRLTRLLLSRLIANGPLCGGSGFARGERGPCDQTERGPSLRPWLVRKLKPRNPLLSVGDQRPQMPVLVRA